MKILANVFSDLTYNVTEFITIAVVMAGLFVAHWLLLGRPRDLNEERRFSRRLIMLLLVIIGIVIILIVLPVEDETRSGLFTLFGLLLTAVIALSSSGSLLPRPKSRPNGATARRTALTGEPSCPASWSSASSGS